MVGLDFRRDSEIRAQERSAHFGDQLLGGVGFGAEAAGEIAVKTSWCSRPVASFMAEGVEEMVERSKGFTGRHQDAVLGRTVSGFARVQPDLSAGCGEECLGGGHCRLRLTRGFGGGIVVSGQSIDLGDIEGGVPL